MGIPSYFNHILKNHPNIIIKKSLVSSDFLFVDANSLIYDVINNYKDSVPTDLQIIYMEIYECVVRLIDVVNPKYKTYICFDGVPPCAKMVQQRQRRFKGTLTNEVLGKELSWNRNQITPGTDFMNGLDEFLTKAFSSMCNVIFSGSCEPMEGEHKICKIIISDPSFKMHNLIIYGLDADLFMLGLLLVFKEHNIFLYKETKYFNYIKGIRDSTLYYFNINVFAEQLSISLYVEKKQAICDYCLLAFLCGNDFLPHNHAVNIRRDGIPFVVDTYLKLNKMYSKPLIDILTGKINWKYFREYITLLVEHENDNILENLKWKIEQKKKVHPLSQADKLDLLPCVDIEKERYLYDNIKDINITLFKTHDTKEVCRNYLEMIEWTWYYYFNNDVIDNSKYYKYGNAPLMKDVLSFIPIMNSERILKKKDTAIISTTTLLLFVIPYKEHGVVIPERNYNVTKTIVYNELPLLKESNFEIDYFLCKYFWEGHLNLPNIDIFKLNQIVTVNV